MRLITLLLLLALAAPCQASPLLFLMQGGNQAFTQDYINGISLISQSGPTTTGTQTGYLAAGDITVAAACQGNGDSSAVWLKVDGIDRDSLICPDGAPYTPETLTYTVAAGEHSVMVYGAGPSFSASSFVLPLP